MYIPLKSKWHSRNTDFLSTSPRCCVLEEQHIQVLEGVRSERLGGGRTPILHSRASQGAHPGECHQSDHPGPTPYWVGHVTWRKVRGMKGEGERVE